MTYHGTERRRDAQTVEALAAEFREFRTESTRYRAETRRDISCLKESFLAFETKYKAHLDAQMASDQYWATLRKEVTSSILKSAMTAAMMAVLAVLALGGKAWFVGWLGGP